mmetsp:Transcript_2341/g.7459  ORF Transcript_2341/g.7459 Transcript_2341/m.7459 type:complete len:358 (+) Transcript_2341:376-1449(+)
MHSSKVRESEGGRRRAVLSMTATSSTSRMVSMVGLSDEVRDWVSKVCSESAAGGSGVGVGGVGSGCAVVSVVPCPASGRRARAARVARDRSAGGSASEEASGTPRAAEVRPTRSSSIVARLRLVPLTDEAAPVSESDRCSGSRVPDTSSPSSPSSPSSRHLVVVSSRAECSVRASSDTPLGKQVTDADAARAWLRAAEGADAWAVARTERLAWWPFLERERWTRARQAVAGQRASQARLPSATRVEGGEERETSASGSVCGDSEAAPAAFLVPRRVPLAPLARLPFGLSSAVPSSSVVAHRPTVRSPCQDERRSGEVFDVVDVSVGVRRERVDSGADGPAMVVRRTASTFFVLTCSE